MELSYDGKLYNEVLIYFMDRKSDGAATDITEVYENLFVGNEVIARDAAKLTELGINLVINLSPREVITDPSIYKPLHIKYYPCLSDDNVYTNLITILDNTVDLIEDTLKADGKVLIHCSSGTRKSPALAIAYLMLKKQLPIWNAVKRVRRLRRVCPSNGLIMQLCSLNRELFNGVTRL